MLVADLHADDFVLDPAFLEAPAIVAVGPIGALVILAALLYQHRHGGPVPAAVLARQGTAVAARRAIAACVALGLLAPVDVDGIAAYRLVGYAREAGSDGATRRRRVLAAIRARRYRARGDRARPVPLPFDEAGADEYPRAPEHGRSEYRELWKTCGKHCAQPVSVTHPVTRSARTPGRRDTSLKDLDLQDHRRAAPDRTGTAPDGAARVNNPIAPFPVLCAVVKKEAHAHPELAADRLVLLEHVKTVCAQARIPYRGADVHKAIDAVAVAVGRSS